MRRTQQELQDHILTVISGFHRGHRAGARNEDLARQVGISERRLREAIAVLVRRRGAKIGSHPDHGIFLIETSQDFALADRCLADESFPTIDRRRALRRSWEGETIQAGRELQQSLFGATT